MANPLQTNGATLTKQTKYAPISVNRMFTGLWTQRNPLREAATPYLYEKFYSGARFDSLWDDGTGTFSKNVEVTNKLTLARRPGLSEYNNNSSKFSNIKGFYNFKWLDSTGTENISVLATNASSTYDATGPSTRTLLYSGANAKRAAQFQSVGNTLYFGDGTNQVKWLKSEYQWAALTTFSSGTFINDSNDNIQVAIGATTASAQNVVIASNVCTLTFTNQIPFYWLVGVKVSLSNFITNTFLNGNSVTITARSYNQITFAFTHGNVNTSDTGTVSTTSGNTGSSQPAWGTSWNTVTTDGSQQWICRGSSIQLWGIAPAMAAPSVTNAARPTPFSTWSANTFYSPSLVIVDNNTPKYLQKLTTSGTTNTSQPTWNTTVGGTTTDGTAVWTNVGLADWQSAHTYAVNDVVAITFSYWVTVFDPDVCFSGNTSVVTNKGKEKFEDLPLITWVATEFGLRMADVRSHEYDGEMIDMGNGELVTPFHRIKRGNVYILAKDAFSSCHVVNFKGTVFNLSVRTTNDLEKHYILGNGNVAHNIAQSSGPDGSYSSYEVTVSAFFKCTTAGTSGSFEPAWADGVGSTVSDNTIVWTNIGSQVTWPTIGASTSVNLSSTIIDSNGDLETINSAGKSGSSHPTWATTSGQTTVDNTAYWVNNGSYSGANTGTWIYSFSGLNSITGHCSNESPISNQIILAENDLISIQGNAFTDPQVDRIRIWRTVQNGSTRIWLDDIVNPGSGTWTYQDTSSDNDLDEFIQAPSLNTIPPTGLQVLTYHNSRVWGAVANTVYYTRTSDSTTGVTTECFPPNNYFAFPSTVSRLWPCSLGLLVFTISDIYLITGSGTTSDPFIAYPFVEGIGLRSYYAFDINGSIVYMFSSDSQLLMFDPSSGISEIGFPIGDILSSWDSNSTYVTWHVAGSEDKALYICDGNNSVYRMSLTSAPETGLMWSPKAVYAGQNIGAMQSVEVTPGTHKLLYANSGDSFVLQRDLSVYTDDSNTYDAWVTIGSVVLAQPGQVAEIAFITTDATAVGSRMSIGVLLDEISGNFQSMNKWVPDPPKLATSTTTYAGRYYMNQTQNPAYCRHMMIQFKWPSEAYANELLQYTIFGAYHQEK